VSTRRRQAYRLPTLGSGRRLRAGRLTRRWLQLFAGLLMAGFSIGLMVEAHLGPDPWNVMHEGLTHPPAAELRLVTIASGWAVLLLWGPLKPPLGVGTVSTSCG
jgi:uncharacterized membrane protein YczE